MSSEVTPYSYASIHADEDETSLLQEEEVLVSSYSNYAIGVIYHLDLIFYSIITPVVRAFFSSLFHPWIEFAPSL